MSHIVILGAGASRAAFPHGDKEGRRLPVMADLVEILDLGPLLSRNHVTSEEAQNFESVFADLYEKDPEAPLLLEIESRLRDYFCALTLPETATLYDRLILSLQPRDIIATFN